MDVSEIDSKDTMQHVLHCDVAILLICLLERIMPAKISTIQDYYLLLPVYHPQWFVRAS